MSRNFPNVFIPPFKICYTFINKGVGGFFMNPLSKYETING